MAAPLAKTGRGVKGDPLSPEERHRHRVEASRRYRKKHPARCILIKSEYRKKMSALYDALRAGPCMDCGGLFPPECMDFDHVRGTKVKGVAMMKDYSQARIAAEVLKCELVCANCHRIRTKARLAQRRAA